MPNPSRCPKISDKDYQARFSEALAPLGADGARHEAARCLYCYDAPCITACPTHIDIPSFIRKIATGNLIGSARTILAANPLGATCARVCPVEGLCEGACVRTATDHAVAIGRLQRHAMDAYAAMGKPFFAAADAPNAPNAVSAAVPRATARGKGAATAAASGSAAPPRVAIVGAGAAGLACAVELRRAGVGVVLFEGRAKAGGLADYGIVPWRLPRDVPALEAREVERAGAEIRTGVVVGEDVTAEQLLAEFDAVFLAVGLGRAKPLGVPGEALRGVVDALEFIERVIKKDLAKLDVGRRVAVIGCGNTAMDAANCAKKLGCDSVTVFYRRTETEAPAYPNEIELAKELGVQFRWLTAPVAIRGARGRVATMTLDTMRLGRADKSGRRKPAPVKGGRFTEVVDTVIRAVGQDRIEELLNHFGVRHARGRVETDAKRRTSNAKVWAGGDLVNGGLEVVNAVEEGKVAARSILEALGVAAPAGSRLVAGELEVAAR